MIGLAFALPLLFFWVRKMIPTDYHLKLLGLLLLGGLQGLMGWYMVKSGLVDQPAVSHFRLAAHLSLAFIIFAALLLCGLSLIFKTRRFNNPAIHLHTLFSIACIGITIIWGAFTAGLDAGLVYNETFPQMGGQWIPPDFWKHESLWQNIIENHSAIQFTHRWLAIITVCVILSLWLHAIIKKNSFKALHAACSMAFIQMGLGIGTLLSGVHVHVAASHQAGAVILLALLLICLHQTRTQRCE